MSTGTRLTRAEAYELAGRVAKHIRPTVQRLRCVGSVRRKEPSAGDIEFLVEPYFDDDFFGQQTPIIEPIKKALLEIGTWKKGADRMMQITDLYGRPGLKLELYLVHPPSTWGVLLGIRTGPRDMSTYLVTACKRLGHRIEDGRAVSLATGEPVPTETEEQFFELAGIEWVPPAQRKACAIALRNDLYRSTQGVRA